MSEEQQPPQFPTYPKPVQTGHQYAERKQSAPLMKIMKHMMKKGLPKKKVLQRRAKGKRFKII